MSGERRGPACVYFPGLDGTGRLLHRQADLHAEYHVHAVSYSQEHPVSYEEMADLGVEHLRKNGPGIVLAESFGGAVALTLALRHPNLVRRLVLVNTFAHFPSRLFIRFAALASHLLPAHPSHPALRSPRGYFFFDRNIPATERNEWWKRTADVPMRAFGFRIRLLADLDLRPRLERITVPALVLAAPNDKVVAPRTGVELSRRLPASRLLRPRVGHAALIHPAVNIARLLADPTLWPDQM